MIRKIRGWRKEALQFSKEPLDTLSKSQRRREGGGGKTTYREEVFQTIVRWY